MASVVRQTETLSVLYSASSMSVIFLLKVLFFGDADRSCGGKHLNIQQDHEAWDMIDENNGKESAIRMRILGRFLS